MVPQGDTGTLVIPQHTHRSGPLDTHQQLLHGRPIQNVLVCVAWSVGCVVTTRRCCRFRFPLGFGFLRDPKEDEESREQETLAQTTAPVCYKNLIQYKTGAMTTVNTE